MEKTKFSQIGIDMFSGVTRAGLPVFVFPRRGYRKAYAFLAVNYGAVDAAFSVDGAPQKPPAGLAHFLEHKMFDMPYGNAMQRFAATGASPNAFTSHAMTAYHFQCTDAFFDNLDTLLSFVLTPYFSPDSVQKEQGIIAQEIRMIEDSPQNRVYENMLAGLYESHPVRVSIAGTVASIADITAETLYACYHAFYHPKNMCLCVAGDLEPEAVFAAADRIGAAPAHEVVRASVFEDPTRAYRAETEAAMEVSQPLFALGFKADPPERGEDTLGFDLLSELAFEALTGPSSPLYTKLYEQGLINRGYDYGAFRFPDGACLLALGESRDPRAVQKALLEEAARIGREGLDEALFARVKNAGLGARLRQLDSLESLCRSQAGAHFAGGLYPSFAALFETFTAEKAARLLSDTLTPARMALSVVNPKETNGIS